ncbi:hypothetical protein KKI95_16090 [Xenorhabdus bovienii]|uniref:hypothetical protein n=1 Tax=Xenorhabdus bovienii TaxID=40576 RepID=UPI0023B352C9|nr:hypothetical protein [Xenorhabdus bovienii]MDE9437408.1 hypothetical protein [Xenorhabdus bovienii]MDE9464638.1 hypothetical protein [Xenorhabdus bovienii]MDE9538837.1 hypothetical protein [Xenorhabdus bovienii]
MSLKTQNALSNELIDIVGDTVKALITSTTKSTGTCKADDIKKVVSVIHEAVNKFEDGSEVNDAIYAYLAQTIV